MSSMRRKSKTLNRFKNEKKSCDAKLMQTKGKANLGKRRETCNSDCAIKDQTSHDQNTCPKTTNTIMLLR